MEGTECQYLSGACGVAFCLITGTEAACYAHAGSVATWRSATMQFVKFVNLIHVYRNKVLKPDTLFIRKKSQTYWSMEMQLFCKFISVEDAEFRRICLLSMRTSIQMLDTPVKWHRSNRLLHVGFVLDEILSSTTMVLVDTAPMYFTPDAWFWWKEQFSHRFSKAILI